jgi:hypothetical protein
MDKLNRPEQALVQTAVRQLADATGLPIAVDHEVHLAGGGIVDALVAVGAQGERHIFAAGAKRTATPATINIALQRLATMAPNHKPIFITAYVNPKQAQELKERGIAFIDTVGNAYIHAGQVYVYIRGNRPEEPAGAPRQATRAFQATGLRVLFGFLHNPALLNANYRDIARATGVAHGTVGWVLTDLREAGYLIEIKKERRLVRVRQLLGRWIEAYHERLKPKLWLGRYEAPTNHWWQTVELGPYAAVWGGEVAAAKLTNGYLTPQVATIYAERVPPELLLRQQLRKNPGGNVHVFKTFWLDNPELTAQLPLADTTDPLLVYADLLGTGDDRNRETAERIFDEHLVKRFPND